MDLLCTLGHKYMWAGGAEFCKKQMTHILLGKDLHTCFLNKLCYQGIQDLWSTQACILCKDHQTIQANMYRQLHCFYFDRQH